MKRYVLLVCVYVCVRLCVYNDIPYTYIQNGYLLFILSLQTFENFVQDFKLHMKLGEFTSIYIVRCFIT